MNLEQKLKHYGLSQEEYERILNLLGREPSSIEWPLFSALWSEHCSYKSSKIHLRNLYSKSEKVVSEDGENAGVVDLGQGEKIAFKMESHNHPSFIEPFQGAATGVGGILRDIFTMGARPIALANYLCFGERGSDRLEYLIEGVVSGISFYGNCVGVPTVTGQTNFDPSYNTNNLVNAFALGYYGKEDKIVSSKIKTPGFSLVYVGAKTGKDGVHGASMASESFDEESESKRPTVQIGDPFFEKCLIESCLEVMKRNLCEAVQDMGAAGLTSSSFEMSVGGGLGLEMDLSLVPLRDSTMTPEEILLSESQERMLMTCDPKNVSEIKKVFSKWGLDAVEIGKVLEEKEIKLLWKGEEICKIDPSLIVESAPRYDRPYSEIKWEEKKGEVIDFDLDEALSSEAGSSRSWIYNQYDQRVGAKTMADCSEPLGVVKLPQSERAVGMVLGCRPELMRLSPVLGGKDSVLLPALQLSLKGFKPWAVTDCLNFGNPQKSEIMSEFVSSLQAMSKACEAFEAPIISGNVSLYNETEGQNIISTPATCVVGLKENMSLAKSNFQKEKSKIYLLEAKNLKWSGYAGSLKNIAPWGEGDLDIQKTKDFCDELCELSPSFISSRVVTKFGALYSLAHMIGDKVGFELSDDIDEDVLKEEVLYQVLVEVDSSQEIQGKTFTAQELGKTNLSGSLQTKDKTWTFSKIQNIKIKGWEKNLGRD